VPNGAASALSSVVKLKALNGTVDITLLLLARLVLKISAETVKKHIEEQKTRW